MSISPAADGHGLTIVHAGFVANILSVSGPNLSRESIDKTHMGTIDWKEFMPADLVDPGELTVEVEYDPQDIPPIRGPTGAITITWGNEAQDQYITQGFMTGFSISGGESGARMTASATFKLTGAPAVE